MGVYADYNLDNIRNPELREIIKTIMDITSGHDHDGSNSKSVTAGTVGDGTVTNAKLATDVKVGSLASLTTAATSSVQAAINELDGDIGDLTSLTTTAQDSAVLAINELDSDIGVLSTLTTTAKSSLVAAINELDGDNAAFATKTGVETLTNKTLTSPTITTMLINDGDAGLTVTSADQTHATPVATIPDIGDAADTFVMCDTAQTLTNKTLTTPVIASIYQDAGKTKLMTLPDTASDTLAALAATQTLANKTLTTPVIASFYQDAGKSKLMTTPDTASDTLCAIAATQTLTNKTLTTPILTTPKIDDGHEHCTIASADQTDSGATATIPDMGTSDTFVMLALAQTLANKTLTTPVIASMYQDAGKTKLMTLPDTASDTLCAIAATQTLTNKTLTSPILTTPKIDDGHEHCTIASADQTDSGATITIPDCGDSADEFVLKDTTQTLTEKTLTAPVMTSPDITFSAASHDYGAAHADWTLSASEAKNLILTATNADAGVNVNAPNTDGKMFVVYNGTGQTLTILVSGQSGVAIANTKTALVRCNGTDYVRVTADA